MRRGEVLGLRWADVDLESGVIRVRQQLQRVGGSLRTAPVKTRAGNCDLPIVTMARAAPLPRQEKQAADREAFGRAWQDTGLAFTTRTAQQPRLTVAIVVRNGGQSPIARSRRPESGLAERIVDGPGRYENPQVRE
jgi:hypothetical protein